MGKESVPKIIINDKINLPIKTAISILLISNHNSFHVMFDKTDSVYFIWKNYLYFSTGNCQPREPALRELHQCTFVRYGYWRRRPVVVGRGWTVAWQRRADPDSDSACVWWCLNSVASSARSTVPAAGTALPAPADPVLTQQPWFTTTLAKFPVEPVELVPTSGCSSVSNFYYQSWQIFEKPVVYISVL